MKSAPARLGAPRDDGAAGAATVSGVEVLNAALEQVQGTGFEFGVIKLTEACLRENARRPNRAHLLAAAGTDRIAPIASRARHRWLDSKLSSERNRGKPMHHPSAQYDDAASLYMEAEHHVMRVEAERPTLLAALGDIDGTEVIDLACGTGAYTRFLADQGARRVLGVDASAGMIAAARGATPPDTAKISYQVRDIATMPTLGAFDVATAVFLLNYARTRGELADFCRSAYANLRPGGRFAGCVPNAEFDPNGPVNPRYGLRPHFPSPASDGQECALTIEFSQPLTIRYHYWSFEAYREALHAAGFRSIAFRPQTPTDDAVSRLGHEFWSAWLANPLNMVFSAVRPV